MSLSLSYSPLQDCCLFFLLSFIMFIPSFLYFKLLIWLIHFLRWTELKANKRQHLVFHIHVLVVSLWRLNIVLFNSVASSSLSLLSFPLMLLSPSPSSLSLSSSLSPSLSLAPPYRWVDAIFIILLKLIWYHYFDLISFIMVVFLLIF